MFQDMSMDRHRETNHNNLNIKFKESLLRVQQYTIEKAPLLRVYPEGELTVLKVWR